MTLTEAHVEHLLGRHVRDADDQVIGRLEEFKVEIIDGDYVVTEFHVGGAALAERIAAFVTQLPFFRLIPFARRGFRVPWTELDLSDPRQPRARCRRAELQQMPLSENEGESA
jgi:hypothetical protein